MTSIQHTVELNDGHKMPRVALGTFQGNYSYELWNTFHRTDDVVDGLRKSLDRLGLEYVNMFLIHWPIALQPGAEPYPKNENGEHVYEDDITPFTDTWKGMIRCKELGLTKSIGVSNFNIRQIESILELGTVRPANLQIEVNPYFLNDALVDFCRKENIQVSCYSPLHKPARPWAKPDDPFVAKDETLLRIGREHGKTAQQVALRFQLQRGLVVIPKSTSTEHQRENLSIFDFELIDCEMEEIRQNCGRHNLRALKLYHLLGTSKQYPFEDVKAEETNS